MRFMGMCPTFEMVGNCNSWRCIETAARELACYLVWTSAMNDVLTRLLQHAVHAALPTCGILAAALWQQMATFYAEYCFLM
jgi:hypothetical protein